MSNAVKTTSKKFIIKFVLIPLTILLVFLFTGYLCILQITSKLPSHISIVKSQPKTIAFNLPFTASLEPCLDASDTNASSVAVQSVNFNEPVSFIADRVGEYALNVKLFGLFNIKTMTVQVLDNNQLIPCGFPIGIYMKTKGVLVVNNGAVVHENGASTTPSQGLLIAGDYIESVNNIPIYSKAEFIQVINENAEQPLMLSVNRHGQLLEVPITPVKDASGEYKIGAWIRDDSQGIGTLTYLDASLHFGALGHGISDTDVGELLQTKGGILYLAKIISISKGQSGTPGEFVGIINYSSANQLGTIQENTLNGIFGTLDESAANIIQEYDLTPLEIGFKEEVHTGEAYIQTYVENKICLYKIQITELNSDANATTKNFTFRVTDEHLLSITNGIVQGMSGSPIIQDNKIIGAVTHVFVEDSACGYGIFIEHMLQHPEN